MAIVRAANPIQKWQIEEFGIADIAGLILALEHGRTTEIPIGVVNGVNKIFTVSSPFVAGTLSVFLNGIKENEFIENTDTQIEMLAAPRDTDFTDKIEVIYTKKVI